MPDVKHMKWWGWGVEGVSFHHEDKPAFQPFVLNAIDLDVNTAPSAPMSLNDAAHPCSRDRRSAARMSLTDAVGAENATQGRSADRIVRTYGKSARDLLRIRAGDIPRVPDVVVYPADEAQVQLRSLTRAVRRGCGDHSLWRRQQHSGSLHAPEDETRPVISLDLGRMNKLIDIDEASGLARIQAGALGPRPGGAVAAHGLVSGALPRQLHPQHAWRLGRNALIRHAVGQVRRYLRHRARACESSCRARCSRVRPLPHTSTGPERTPDGARLRRSTWCHHRRHSTGASTSPKYG